MDMYGAMNAMQNPQGTMMGYAMQGMIAQHPDQWKQAQEMFGGKNHNEQVKALRKLYKDRGMDLDSIARQWGIQI